MNTNLRSKSLPHEIILGRLNQMGIGRVEVTHFRRNKGDGEYRPTPYFRNARMQYAIAPTGGSTVVSVDLGNNVIVKAAADCSESDIFNRRQGLTIALRRLYKQVVEKNKVVADLD